MPLHLIRSALLLALVLTGGMARSQTRTPETRAELLYNTHCVACHNAQVHWRSERAARDWNGLLAQVRRWQGAERLQWSESDISEVARYLNDTIYHYAPVSVSQRE